MESSRERDRETESACNGGVSENLSLLPHLSRYHTVMEGAANPTWSGPADPTWGEAFEAAPLSDEEELSDPYADEEVDAAFYDPLSEVALRQYTGTENLEAVRSLEMRVDVREVSASLIGERMPNLVELKLSGSRLSSLRELGTSLKHLEVLWVSRCGLTDLEGLSAFPALTELYASFNEIADLSAIGGVESLELLDLDSNSVAQLHQLNNLVGCDLLTSITLEGNPVEKDSRFREELAMTLPHLEYLDDMPFSTQVGTASAGDALEDEMELVMDGIRHARLGIDDTMFDLDAQQAALATFNVHDPYRPRTALPTSSAFRPDSAAASLSRSGPGCRPATAASGVASLIRQRPGSGKPPMIAARPMSAGVRPGSRASSGGSRPGSARPTSRSSDSPITPPRSREGPRGETEDAGSSALTSGTTEAVCGNLAKALRHRRASRGEDGDFVPRPAPRPELDMLEELKRWKVETAAMNAMGPVGQDIKPDSFWRDGGTITHKANSDGTEANVWRPGDEDDAVQEPEPEPTRSYREGVRGSVSSGIGMSDDLAHRLRETERQLAGREWEVHDRDRDFQTTQGDAERKQRGGAVERLAGGRHRETATLDGSFTAADLMDTSPVSSPSSIPSPPGLAVPSVSASERDRVGGLGSKFSAESAREVQRGGQFVDPSLIPAAAGAGIDGGGGPPATPPHLAVGRLRPKHVVRVAAAPLAAE